MESESKTNKPTERGGTVKKKTENNVLKMCNIKRRKTRKLFPCLRLYGCSIVVFISFYCSAIFSALFIAILVSGFMGAGRRPFGRGAMIL